jgi:hypothetical protein
VPCCDAASEDALGPAFLVTLRTRQFRNSPKPFAFLQIGVAGKILRLHPFDAFAGLHELRISEPTGLTYLTEPRTGRTWVSTLGPFRNARRAGREAAAVAIAAPFASLESAQICGPQLVRIAQWLKAHRENQPIAAVDA